MYWNTVFHSSASSKLQLSPTLTLTKKDPLKHGQQAIIIPTGRGTALHDLPLSEMSDQLLLHKSAVRATPQHVLLSRLSRLS
ncbi:hypothetical protein PoB_002007100 [Plakobranchus ocellatus]|uniref:Uncharacterized protein n=1 Tax=Plakobranchus ocellatus TaxID=259542 RepID=A0AAV3ZG08_9GAST|nr:hypothetical protein PoB_002007100 [Plakobranchus ocellatus]